MKLISHLNKGLFISFLITSSLPAAIVKIKTTVNTQASEHSPKVKVTKSRYGHLAIGEKIQVLEVIKNKEGIWYRTPRGFVKKKYFKYNKKKENPADYIIKPIAYTLNKKNELVKTNFKPLEIKKYYYQKEIKKPIFKINKKVKQIPIKKEVLIIPTKDRKKENNYFIGFNINQNNLQIEQNDKIGSISLNKELDKSGLSYSIEFGKKINNYIISTNYEIVNLDDVNIKNLTFNIDYIFKHKLNPFIGLSLGKSDLLWEIDPLVNSQTKDTKLTSLIYAIQAGIYYPIDKKWSIFSALKYQKYNFKTELISTPAQSDILHNSKTSFGLGLRYFFNR
jgi:hypothetical protein